MESRNARRPSIWRWASSWAGIIGHYWFLSIRTSAVGCAHQKQHWDRARVFGGNRREGVVDPGRLTMPLLVPLGAISAVATYLLRNTWLFVPALINPIASLWSLGVPWNFRVERGPAQ